MIKKIAGGLVSAVMLCTTLGSTVSPRAFLTFRLLLHQITQRLCKNHCSSMNVSRQVRFLSGTELSGVQTQL